MAESKEHKHTSTDYRPQKNVFRARDRFNDNGEEYGGSSKPVGANVISKTTGKEKKFVLKSFEGVYAEESCAREKLCFDLLKLCGVKVPKSYITEDEKSGALILASRKEEGYQDLFDCLFQFAPHSKQWGDPRIDLNKTDEWLQNKATDEEKPIVGLFENVAVFMFLGDRDAIGTRFRNIGLIDEENRFQAVKIDPGFCCLYNFDNDISDQFNLDRLKNGKVDGYAYDLGHNAFVFKHCTEDQIHDGMGRVARLTDEQLRSVIYNEKISFKFLPEKTRDSIFTTLKTRRDAYRKVLNEKNVPWMTAIHQENQNGPTKATDETLADKPIFWTKYKVFSVFAGGGLGAAIGSKEKLIFDPGIYNSSALAGMGIGLVVLCLGVKFGIDKCREQCSNEAAQGLFK